MTMIESDQVSTFTTPEEMVAEFDLGDQWDENLLSVGKNLGLTLKGLRTAEGIRTIAERMADHFVGQVDQHYFTVRNIPVELTPDDRKSVVKWLDEYIPLADDAYRWDAVFTGRNDEFELAIKKRITRTRR